MISSPFFIIGAARSGTTLFTLMLNAHSLIAIPYESHFFPEYYRRRDSLGDLEKSDKDDFEENMLKADPTSISQTYKWEKKSRSGGPAIAFEITGKLLNELGYPEG